MILVIVPTYGRAHKMLPLAENVLAATDSEAWTMFCVEDDDSESVRQELDPILGSYVINKRKRNYAGAFNCAYQLAAEAGIPFTHAFAAADDVHFSDGWDKPALALLDARPELRVAGTNDLHNANVLAGQMATAYLIDRRYIDETGGVIDQPPGIVQCEAYEHNYTDTEFCATAEARGVWAPCLEAVVEHMHPVWGRGEWDPGYARSYSGMLADGVIFESRRHLWEHA